MLITPITPNVIARPTAAKNNIEPKLKPKKRFSINLKKRKLFSIFDTIFGFIGFILIAIILTWMFYNQQPVTEEQQKIEATEKEIEKDLDDEKTKLSDLEKFGQFSSVLSLSLIHI